MRAFGVTVASVALASPFAGLPSPAAGARLDPPDPPLALEVSTALGVGAMSLTWIPPANSWPTGYKVYSQADFSGPWSEVISGPCATEAITDTSCVVTGLVPGTDYSFVVTALDGSVEGEPSDVSASLRAIAPPGTPAAPTAVVDGSLSMAVSWTGSTGTLEAPIAEYQLEMSDDGGTSYHSVPAGGCQPLVTSPCSVNDLSSGTQYRFRLIAINDAGSAISTGTTALAAVRAPGRPTSVAAQVDGVGAASVSWQPPSGTVDGYRVYTTSTTGGTYTQIATGACAAPTASPCLISGLTPGNVYYFKITAVHGGLEGDRSGISNGIIALDVPGRPGTPAVTVAGDLSLQVSWAAPTETTGTPIGDYRVEVSVDGNGFGPVTAGGCASPSASPCTMTGLTAGSSYEFRVSAVNAVGTGTVSAGSTPIVVATKPSAPTLSSATRGDGSASLSFTPGSDGGSAIIRYEVSTDDGVNWATLATTGGSATVTGLTNGTPYTIKIRAVNAAGAGTASVGRAVTPATTPAAPTGLTVMPGDTTAAVTFTPGDDGGDAVIRYEVSTDNGTNWATLGGSGTVTGLTNGTPYAIKVRAVNGVGAGTASGGQTVTPAPTAAGPPTGLNVTAGNASLGLSFQPPADDGGTPVTGYQVSVDDGANWHVLPTQSGSGATRIATVTGLVNASTYLVRVRAVNDAGSSEPSGSVSGTPVADLPGVPAGLVAGSGNASIAVTLVPPLDDGGGAILSYDVSVDDGANWLPLSTQDGAGGTRTGTVTGLSNGSAYQIRVRAVNSTGAGQSTDAVAVVAGVPSAPTMVDASAGTSSVAVSWHEPVDTAELVTAYTVLADPGQAACTTATAQDTTCVLGAVAGVSYTVTVIAHTAAGVDSAPSEASNAVIPTAPVITVTVPDTDANLTTDQGPIEAAAPGQDIVLIGTGFAAYSTITVAIYSKPTVLATITADPGGNFTHTITVPANLPIGPHTFIATGVDPDGEPYAMKLAVTVAPAAESAGPGSAALPTTGAAIVNLVAAGLALIALGLGALLTLLPQTRARVRRPSSAASQ